jgi:hypothetical protein
MLGQSTALSQAFRGAPDDARAPSAPAAAVGRQRPRRPVDLAEDGHPGAIGDLGEVRGQLGASGDDEAGNAAGEEAAQAFPAL